MPSLARRPLRSCPAWAFSSRDCFSVLCSFFVPFAVIARTIPQINTSRPAGRLLVNIPAQVCERDQFSAGFAPQAEPDTPQTFHKGQPANIFQFRMIVQD